MSEEITLRDTFAAAALTGLLAQGDDGSFSEESYARAAYRWADAMLRGRGVTEPLPKEKRAEVSYGMTTIHDAAPAATAASADDRTDKAAPSQRRDGTGDTRLRPANVAEAWKNGRDDAPPAWAVTIGSGCNRSVYEAFASHQHDEAVALAKQCLFGTEGPLPLEPLYFGRRPTLTDEEREAIELFATLSWTTIRWSEVEKNADTLRNLLERLK
jgi:hypothetical protein